MEVTDQDSSGRRARGSRQGLVDEGVSWVGFHPFPGGKDGPGRSQTRRAWESGAVRWPESEVAPISAPVQGSLYQKSTRSQRAFPSALCPQNSRTALLSSCSGLEAQAPENKACWAPTGLQSTFVLDFSWCHALRGLGTQGVREAVPWTCAP